MGFTITRPETLIAYSGAEVRRISSTGALDVWNFVEVSVGERTFRGRYRLEGEAVVLEWRGGRHIERCGLVKPDVVAMSRLKRLAAQPPIAA